MSTTDWQPVIGLEVHCQLDTRTKLFCGCENRFGAPPNENVCEVCSAQPGALPVLNERAVELAIRAALALGGEVAERSEFARKNYFYCDLPKGYQISQYDQPFCRGGSLTLASGKVVRFHRIHMEEDAGKAIHDRGTRTVVDLNRAGVPLIEMVTEADLTSAVEATEFLQALRERVRWIGVSDGDMEKGNLRCDVNVSVHKPGTPWGTKVECKNLNSFRNVADAIDHEIARQSAAYEAGDPAGFPVQETRLFDPAAGVTRTMRSKENEADYRYFPDPDLPLLEISRATCERIAGDLPDAPEARRARFEAEFKVSTYDAGVLTSSREVAEFFEATVAAGSDPKEASNWITNEVLRLVGDDSVPGTSLGELALTPQGLAKLIALVTGGTIHRKAAKNVLRGMLVEGKDAATLVRELGLEQVSDVGAIEAWCREALVGKDELLAEVRGGKTKALGALMGPILKASSGKANPKLVQETLLRLALEEGTG